MNLVFQPTLNALLNAISAILLLSGYIQIKRGRKLLHKRFMLAAVLTSAFFLISYLIYHYSVGSVPYLRYDWTRPVYFIILVPHIILAALMVPFILAALFFALIGKFEIHRRLVRWIWPTWMFVSLSGIMVYVMLYHF